MASYDVIAISVLLGLLVMLVPAPILLGRFLGKKRPRLRVFYGSLLGSLPATVPFVAVLLMLILTGGVSELRNCQPPECGIGIIWTELFLWLAIPVFLTGFVFGWLGFLWGRRVADRGDSMGDF